MARYLTAALLRARLTGDASGASPYSFTRDDQFTEGQWASEMAAREAVDSLLYPTRWRVVWVAHNVRRVSYMRGTYESVLKRCNAFFTSGSVTIDPAPVQNAPERFDVRLATPNLIHQEKTK